MTADVDHQSACRAHGRNHPSAHLKHTGEVELHQPIPAVQGHLKQPSCPGSTSVVDQYRWCKPLTQQCCDPRSNLLRLGEINGSIHDALTCCSQFSQQEVGERLRCATRGSDPSQLQRKRKQRCGQCRADAPVISTEGNEPQRSQSILRSWIGIRRGSAQ